MKIIHLSPEGTTLVYRAEYVSAQLKNNKMNDLWKFLLERKKFWLLPVIIVLVILSSLLIVGAVTGAAPFIYTLF
jgi:hypothetical protein